jgi:hypothetical protein
VAFNGFGSPASFTSAGTLELNSIYLTAAFNDGLNVTVTGLLNGVTVDSTTLVVNTSGPTLEAFNWAGINAVDFSSCCGVHDDSYLGSGTQFVIDNLSIVPEPSTWAMLLLGFAGLGFAGHRRSRKSAARVEARYSRCGGPAEIPQSGSRNRWPIPKTVRGCIS